MKVLTVFAHHDRRSFCGGVLEHFTEGLADAGDINGRIPLLHHQRALIMTSTIFDENAYDDGIRDAIAKVIDDWGFRCPGIEDVEHVYCYAATAAPPETIYGYLDQAYQLGKEFGAPRQAGHALVPNT